MSAADWIKWVKGLPEKPEIITMAHMLNMSRREVAACCMIVWEWVDSNSSDGCYAPSVTKAFLDERIRVTGFADAMEKTGWLKVEKNGLIFPNGDRHNGQTAKRRALTNRRMSKMRDAASVTKASPDKSRVDKSNKPPISPLVEAEQIYSAYPRKQGRGAALKAIAAAAKKKPADYLLERTKAYAEAVAKWPSADREFIPHPATWFNQERYEDDPSTWERGKRQRLLDAKTWQSQEGVPG